MVIESNAWLAQLEQLMETAERLEMLANRLHKITVHPRNAELVAAVRCAASLVSTLTEKLDTPF